MNPNLTTHHQSTPQSPNHQTPHPNPQPNTHTHIIPKKRPALNITNPKPITSYIANAKMHSLRTPNQPFTQPTKPARPQIHQTNIPTNHTINPKPKPTNPKLKTQHGPTKRPKQDKP